MKRALTVALLVSSVFLLGATHTTEARPPAWKRARNNYRKFERNYRHARRDYQRSYNRYRNHYRRHNRRYNHGSYYRGYRGYRGGYYSPGFGFYYGW
ncbi:hypothetical protein [Gimesia chilikensis]|uniref:Uncharacterized protein n=1 Tax=Gimesia chilikensis TaxID=2605989 RepID=A0A517PWP4_9PLAN|nr:hypothetical protein [Gimesia chilikensis]MCR9231760.1 hypothetical protein [bacterium]QDT23793.1 hypothetical protein HG66A1_56180 [Gimesia chilikensis]QDT87600.1 hypothetical protein MalM14_52880 [Gimesia chilikensis]